MNVVREIARKEFLEEQAKLRRDLTEALGEISKAKLKLDAEDRALEIREHKIEYAMSLAPKYSDKWWLLTSSLNVVIKRRLEIPKERDLLRGMALELSPAVKHASLGIPKLRERAL